MSSFSVVSSRPTETAQIASVLTSKLRPGDAVLLTGDLAAGKTTFVKAVVSALGSTDIVTSPTFTLAQFYSTRQAPVLHIDTYRLSDLGEYRDLGLDEYYESSVSLIEWGDLVTDDFPCRLSVRFERVALQPATEPPAGGTDEDEDVRTLTFSSTCDRWTAVLDDLHAELLEKAS